MYRQWKQLSFFSKFVSVRHCSWHRPYWGCLLQIINELPFPIMSGKYIRNRITEISLPLAEFGRKPTNRKIKFGVLNLRILFFGGSNLRNYENSKNRDLKIHFERKTLSLPLAIVCSKSETIIITEFAVSLTVWYHKCQMVK